MSRRSLLSVLALTSALTSTACGDDDDRGGGSSARDAATDVDGGGTPAGDDAGPSSAGDELTQAGLMRVTTELASDAYEGRDEGTPGGIAAREYLIDALTDCGLVPAGVDGFQQTVEGGAGVNVLARVPGSDAGLAERHVLVSAHYDHLGVVMGQVMNGANDNAAGVAIALGVACDVARSPLRRSLLVAFWDAEEPPTFLRPTMGSRFYAEHPTVPLTSIDAALVMDLVGGDTWPGFDGHFLMGEESSAELTAALDAVSAPEGLRVFRAGLHLIEEIAALGGTQPWSDYDPFRDAGVPHLFLSNGQNKLYHTAGDDLAALDPAQMEKQAQYLADVVRQLGGADVTPAFVPGGADYARDARTLAPLLEATVAEGGMADALGLTPASRQLLEQDVTAIRAVDGKLAGGGAATAQDVATLRKGAQHILCLAGSTFEENLCGLL